MLKLFFSQQQSSLTETMQPAKAKILAAGPSWEKLACLCFRTVAENMKKSKKGFDF